MYQSVYLTQLLSNAIMWLQWRWFLRTRVRCPVRQKSRAFPVLRLIFSPENFQFHIHKTVVCRDLFASVYISCPGRPKWRIRITGYFFPLALLWEVQRKTWRVNAIRENYSPEKLLTESREIINACFFFCYFLNFFDENKHLLCANVCSNNNNNKWPSHHDAYRRRCMAAVITHVVAICITYTHTYNTAAPFFFSVSRT